jgi:acetyl-CoA acyltransferase
MREAVIVEAVRTPVGKRGGQLADWHPTDLLAHTLRTLVERSGVDVDVIADVITGCVIQQGEQAGNISRWASLGAGLPESLPAVTIDRQCGSGQQAIHFAAQSIRSGDCDIAIGAGVESMSRVDLGPLFNPGAGLGPWYGERALARYQGTILAQGPSAELIAKKWGFTREDLDAYSAESHRRAHAATEAGHFTRQLVPLDGRDGPMTRDEGIRAVVDLEKMAGLRPAFAQDGVLTGANSSQISDGAAAVLLAERSVAEAAGLRPRAVIRSMAAAGDDPLLQFTAILPAARRALNSAGLTIEDIDRVEVNEAFAPVPMLFASEFGISTDKVNVNGGSIAVGHPLGSTGARMITDLVKELERSGGRYGMLTICEGGGMANSTIIERVT